VTSSISAGAPQRLPNAEEPFADESLPGFLKRMAEANGFHGLRRFVALLQPDFSTFRQAAFLAARHEVLADFLALEPGELQRLCYGDGPVRRVLGRDLAPDLVAIGDRKACPLCLEDAPYHRAIWDVVPLTVCPVHAVRLVDRCTCGARLGWGGEPILHCANLDCGGDVRDIPAEAVPEAEMGGARALAALLWHGECAGLDGEVAGLPVGERALLMFRLGLVAAGHERMTRAPHFAKRHPDRVHLVLDAGWRVCEGWPRGFHAILDAKRASAGDRRGRFGVRQAFGMLHRRIENLGIAPHAQLLRRAMTDYVLGCPDLATRAPEIRRARSAADLHDQHATVTEAMSLLEVGYERVRELADMRGMWLVPPTGKGAPALMRADLLHQLHAEQSFLLNKADVRKMLEVGKKTVVKLHEAGLIVAQPSTADRDVLAYTRESVEALVAALDARLPSPPCRAPRLALTAAGVARSVNIPGYDSGDVVRAVMDGLLAPVAVSARRRGLHRFLFRREDVQRFGGGLAGQRATMSVDEASRRLGVKQEVAYHWVRTGRLATVQGTTRDEPGRRITEDSLARFRAEFVTGTEVAKRFGLGVRWVSVHLCERGIQAVSGPGVDGARQYLFRRADLLGFGKASLVSGSAKRNRHLAKGKRMNQSQSVGLRFGLTADVRRLLGDRFAPRAHSLLGSPGGVVIRIMLAANRGVVGTYRFLLSRDHAACLEGARRAYVVLGFSDQPDFLLVPWSVFRAHVEALGGPPAKGYLPVVLRAASNGMVTPFGDYACSRRA